MIYEVNIANVTMTTQPDNSLLVSRRPTTTLRYCSSLFTHLSTTLRLTHTGASTLKSRPWYQLELLRDHVRDVRAPLERRQPVLIPRRCSIRLRLPQLLQWKDSQGATGTLRLHVRWLLNSGHTAKTSITLGQAVAKPKARIETSELVFRARSTFGHPYATSTDHLG